MPTTFRNFLLAAASAALVVINILLFCRPPSKKRKYPSRRKVRVTEVENKEVTERDAPLLEPSSSTTLLTPTKSNHNVSSLPKVPSVNYSPLSSASKRTAKFHSVSKSPSPPKEPVGVSLEAHHAYSPLESSALSAPRPHKIVQSLGFEPASSGSHLKTESKEAITSSGERDHARNVAKSVEREAGTGHGDLVLSKVTQPYAGADMADNAWKSAEPNALSVPKEADNFDYLSSLVSDLGPAKFTVQKPQSFVNKEAEDLTANLPYAVNKPLADLTTEPEFDEEEAPEHKNMLEEPQFPTGQNGQIASPQEMEAEGFTKPVNGASLWQIDPQVLKDHVIKGDMHYKPLSVIKEESSVEGPSLLESEKEDLHSKVKRPAPADIEGQILALDVVAGPGTGKQLLLNNTRSQMYIGRNPDNDLQIADPEVSGRHALVSWAEDKQSWLLMDVGSLNGTRLNGRSISIDYKVKGAPEPIKEGDLLELGNSTRLRLSSHSADGSQKRTHTDLSNERLPLLSSIHEKVPPLADETFGDLGLHMAVHQRLGVDHKRTGGGCEDVPAWTVPLSSRHSNLGLFCIFDGHQGVRAAQLASKTMPEVLSEALASRPPGLALSGADAAETSKLLEKAFLRVDATLSMDEGCTATVAMVECKADGQRRVQVANVGDSSAVLLQLSTGRWLKLSEDHRIASSERERARLQERGHTVRSRLFGLNISRMLGDRCLKEEDLGFLAVPYVSPPIDLDVGERYLLMIASDGVWDVLPEERAVGIVLDAYAKRELTPSVAAEMLVEAALKLKSKDDITTMVVDIDGQAVQAESSDMSSLTHV